MAVCSFCGREIPHGTGTMLIRNDAKILWFCSSKCEKNMTKLNRKPRNQPWTKEAASAKHAAKVTAQHKSEAAESAKLVEPAKQKKAEKAAKKVKPDAAHVAPTRNAAGDGGGV